MEDASQQWQREVPLDRGSSEPGSSLPSPVVPAFRLSERFARETTSGIWRKYLGIGGLIGLTPGEPRVYRL